MEKITLEVVYNELQHISKKVDANNQILTGNGSPEDGMCYRIAGCETKISAMLEDLKNHIERQSEFEKSLTITNKTNHTVSEKTILGISPETRSLVIGWLIRIGVFFVAGKEAFSLMK